MKRYETRITNQIRKAIRVLAGIGTFGRCHWLVILILSLVIPAFLRAQPMQVGVYYYPWHGRFSGGHGFTDTLRDRLVPKQGPAIGRYSNHSAATTAAHIDQSKRGKISFWAVSWWGPNSAEDVTFRNSILGHPRAGELKYCIHYESPGRLGKFESPDYSKLTDDFRYLARTYFANPNYLRINDRPVVVIYLTRAYFNTPASRSAISGLKETMQREYGYTPYLIGDDLFGGTVNVERAKLWDAVTDYDVYGTVLQSNGSTQKALDVLTEHYRDAKARANAVGVGFIPTATPGFNDRGVRDGHRAAPRYRTDVPNAPEGSLFTDMLDQAVLPNLDPKTNNILLITSFNEWHEDTQIEATTDAPATSTDDSGNNRYTQGLNYPGYGNLYLDILAKRAGKNADLGLRNAE